MRRVGMSPLPFVIAFILGENLEATARQAFAATGADPYFLLKSPYRTWVYYACNYYCRLQFTKAFNMTRPNILLISADQHRADCFGFEGRNIKTPHLDQLARDGTRFSNCITPTVICQPARASIS